MADEDYRKEFLETHNAYRKLHDAPPLIYNNEMNKIAQKWADELLALNKLQHSSTEDGENVYCSWHSAPVKQTGREPVDSWYSEVKDYDFKKPGFKPNTGHFTQVVWKDTRELGLGFATDGKAVYVVGQYRPPGNISCDGYFEKNVISKE